MRHDGKDRGRSRGTWALFAPLGAVVIASGACSRLESSGGSGGGSSDSASGASSGPSGPSGNATSSTSTGSSGASVPSDMVVSNDASIATDASRAACADTSYSDPWSSPYTPDPAVTTWAQQLVNGLSVNQLATLMTGEATGCPSGQYTDIFQTPGLPGTVNGWKFRDGPRGVCMVANSTVAVGSGNYATRFPSEAARGAAFDMDLEQKIGAAMGDEMVASGHNLILAPVINILRHPAWGRSQETYGEDSFLLGRLGTAYTTGVQQYVPACVKHFAAYNIENGRDSGNVSKLDEQTAYEVYGRHFEMVVQDGGVACVMAAYNQIQIGNNPPKNCTSNPQLLGDMLRTTFGFKGFVLSDWWAMPGGQSCNLATDTEKANAADAVNAGLDMELPWMLNYSQLQADVATNTVTQAALKTSAARILAQEKRFQLASGNGLRPASSTLNNGNYSITNNNDHIQLAYQAALESMVLLKNDKSTLPIASSVKTVAVLGATVPYQLTNTDVAAGTTNFAIDVRTGDLGSSRTYNDPAHSMGPYDGIKAEAPMGINVITGRSAADASSADFIVVMAGLTMEDEGEGYTGAKDRTSFSLDDKLVNVHHMSAVQDPLITAVAKLNKPMVVVLEGGSVIDMPWLASVPAVVMAWYPGQMGGKALGDLIFGKANFSGKLPVTWGRWSDEPAFDPSQTTTMDYYVGYRYFDQNAITPIFPFGAGLSYTSFSYSNLHVPCATVTKGSVVDVQVNVTNSGTVDGDEIAFLFVSYPNTQVRRSKKELKGFHRASVKAGQTVQITLPLRVEDLKYWDATSHSWKWENGPVNLMVGGSSTALPLTDSITVMN